MHKLNLKDEINSLLEISSSSRPWHTSLFTGLSLSGPLFIAAYFDAMKLGVIASMAGLLFLYTLKTPIHHRMAVLMACGFGLMFSFIAGGLTHLTPNFISLTLGLLTLIVALGTRYYQIGGSYFFVMVATIIAFMPLQTDELIELTGYFSLGLIWAWMTAFLYSILT